MGSIQPLILSFVQDEIEIMIENKEAKKRIEFFIFLEGINSRKDKPFLNYLMLCEWVLSTKCKIREILNIGINIVVWKK
jgi:hypothetical protein